MPASSKTTKKSSSRTKRKASSSSSRKAPSSSSRAITNYTTAVRWLAERPNFERQRLVNYDTQTFDLSRMRALLEKLGNPHEPLQCVHIAGTKGKGSTIAMLASMLENCGYTVGKYTSPHLTDLRERIMIGDHMISHADFADLAKQVSKAVDSATKGEATYFEVLTAIGLMYFAEEAVDLAIIETGLGGRLDATNVITPLVVGLTHISYDHMNILGSELTQIAGEKAGIMKKDVPAISVIQEPEVAEVFRKHAEEVGCPIFFTGTEIDFSYRFEANKELGRHTRVSITTDTSRFEHLAVPLQGEHQANNCGLALSLLDALKAHSFHLKEEKVIAGLAKTELPGRMEVVWREPRVVIDGAHNALSIQALIRALGAHITYDSLVMIFGCAQDKDINGMLKQVGLGADKMIFTKARLNPRAMEPEDLQVRFNDLSGKMSQTAPNLDAAIQLAGRAVSRDNLIVITGSFYLAGEARKHFAERAASK